MPSKYVPRSDTGLRDWATAFAAHISADPARFGRTSPEAVALQALVNDYVLKLTAALDRPTRTAGTVAAKQSARIAMVAELRRLSQRIRFDPTVSDADKRSLGLALVKSPRTRTAAPTTIPLVVVTVTAPNRHTIRFADADSPTRRAKPAGIVGLQLFAAITSTPRGILPTPPASAATFRAFVTRQLKPVDFPTDQAGQTAHYYARWQNTRGEYGPWSAVASLTIAA